MDQSIQSQNHLLASLPSADFELLRPHLKQIELAHEKVLLRLVIRSLTSIFHIAGLSRWLSS
jgi:hypothetical protein